MSEKGREKEPNVGFATIRFGSQDVSKINQNIDA